MDSQDLEAELQILLNQEEVQNGNLDLSQGKPQDEESSEEQMPQGAFEHEEEYNPVVDEQEPTEEIDNPKDMINKESTVPVKQMATKSVIKAASVMNTDATLKTFSLKTVGSMPAPSKLASLKPVGIKPIAMKPVGIKLASRTDGGCSSSLGGANGLKSSADCLPQSQIAKVKPSLHKKPALISSNIEESVAKSDKASEKAIKTVKSGTATQIINSKDTGNVDDASDKENEHGEKTELIKPKKTVKTLKQEKTIKDAPEKVAKQEKSKVEKKPVCRSAYMFFAEDQRNKVKSELPEDGNSFTDVSRRLGELWKSLSYQDRAPYDAQAAEEKKINGPLLMAWKSAHPKEKSKEKKIKNSVCKKGTGQDHDEIAVEDEIIVDLSDRENELNSDSEMEDVKHKTTKKSKPKEKVKKSDKAANDDCDEDNEIQNSGMKRRRHADEEEDSADEWGWDDTDIGEAILAKSSDGKKFVVTVKDKPLDSMGLVDAYIAKRQRQSGPDASQPVTLQMLQEYEAFETKFDLEIRDRTDRSGELDLEDLEEGSALEACYVLGKLQWTEYDMPLSNVMRKGKKDRMLKLPMIGLSFMVQRMINLERAKCLETKQRLNKALSLLAENDINFED